jgi:serine/threonine protein kinase
LYLAWPAAMLSVSSPTLHTPPRHPFAAANFVDLPLCWPCSDLLGFTDLYVVFECMDTDLAKLTRDDTQCLTIPHVRWFLYQLLLSIKYTHSARVLHRDIKPANILLTEACDLKLCDFGLARSLDDEGDDEERDVVGVQGQRGPAGGQPGAGEDPASALPTSSGSAVSVSPADGSGMPAAPPGPVHRQMTRHVVTRWYRAPEVRDCRHAAYAHRVALAGPSPAAAASRAVCTLSSPTTPAARCPLPVRVWLPPSVAAAAVQ